MKPLHAKAIRCEPDNRSHTIDDSAMYSEALANVAEALDWSVVWCDGPNA
jgi:hypothetical protein